MQRTVMITGAAGGIGGALCYAFKQEGYVVIATDLEPAAGPADRFINADLNDICEHVEYRNAVVAQLGTAIGGDKLDVLVNNAAVQIVKPVTDINAEDWRKTLNVNVVAPFILIKGLLTYLSNANGSVVNISSIHSTLTKPGFVCYATSKAALSGLTKSAAVELGGKVRVNAINPAATATPMLAAGFKDKESALRELGSMHPLGRIAEPEEIARTAVFLASEKASFINGACLNVDGGISARLHDPE
jgi:NAD(P)-dependent dehydrogenase (short-subunit alcohol dehydrogenase family)